MTKSELHQAFLEALDKHHDGEMLDYVWRIGKERTTENSMPELRGRVGAAQEEEAAKATAGLKRSAEGGPSAGPKGPQEPQSGLSKPPRRSLRLAGKLATMELDDSDAEEEEALRGPKLQ